MDCSWGKLNLISDFLQDIPAQALPFGPPPSKSKSILRLRHFGRIGLAPSLAQAARPAFFRKS
jgi:hypothetical protein